MRLISGDSIRFRSSDSFLSNANESILLDPNRQLPRDSIQLHVRSNEDTNDGIKIIAYSKKNSCERVPAQTCFLRVFKVDVATWNRTLLHSETLSPEPDYSFQLDLTEAQLGIEVIGETVIFVSALINRFQKRLCDEKYFNEIGIFGYLIRLKNKVQFLELTKRS